MQNSGINRTGCYWKLRIPYHRWIVDSKLLFPFLRGKWVAVIGFWDLRFTCNLVLVICPRLQLQFHVQSNWPLFRPAAADQGKLLLSAAFALMYPANMAEFNGDAEGIFHRFLQFVVDG
jgi:hypothetical protein